MSIKKEAWHVEAEETMKGTDPLYDALQRVRSKGTEAIRRVEELERAIEKELDAAEDQTAAPYQRDRIRRDLMKLRKMRDTYPHITTMLGDPDFRALETRYLG